MTGSKRKIIIWSMTLLCLILTLTNIFVGSVDIPFDDVFSILIGHPTDNPAYHYIIISGRLPQAITALLAGASLATAGLMLQTLFRNPLAGPSILGITSGASLGVGIVMLLFGGIVTAGWNSFGGNMAIIIGAFIGSFLIMVILIVLSRMIRSNLSLLIAGMMIGYLATSIVTLLSSVSTAQGIKGYVMWGLGSFSGVPLERIGYFAIICLIGLSISLILIKPLNLLLLGDNYAVNLGVNIKKTRTLILLSTGVLTSIVTAYCGPISFIGLAVPHIARMILRTDDHKILLPATILCGACLALTCNVISVLPQGNVIPINALTPIAGVPVVLYVLLQRKKN